MAFKKDLKMFTWTVLLVYFVFPISTKANVQADRKFPTNRNGDRFTNMVLKGTGTIYVAENGFVHILNASLNSVNNFSTCFGDGCTNINKILSVFGDNKLVLCGTGNNGLCQVWNGNQLIYNSSTTIGDPNYLVVSSDIDRPAVGLVHEEDLFLGVTFGAGINIKDSTYEYLLSRRGIKESFTPFGVVDLKMNMYENYLVYFKKVFEHKGFIYFLTNQKLKMGSEGYTSKLVRMCINETIKIRVDKKWIKSYTDIPMSCKVDGVDYNLLQDAEFLPRKGVLVAAFTKGDDPENPKSGSAICVYTIDTMTAAILNAKDNFITCDETGSIERGSAYLDIDLQRCVNQTTYQVLKDDYYICPKEGRGTKVIGTNTLQPSTAYKINDTSLTIKTVKGVERYSLYPDVFLGTDKGSINKITVLDDLTVFQYESLEIDNGHPVLGINELDYYIYILTNRKVFRVKNTECSTYTTCKETMAAKNPSCGWCVGENRCTKRDDCSNTWLSSFSECVSIVASPKYVSVDSRGNVNISVKTINLPSNFMISTLKCKYLDGNVQVGGDINLVMTSSNGNFECRDPGVVEHKLLGLQLAYNGDGNDFGLAETTIQVYKCTEYKKCGICTISAEVNCEWCASTAKCQNAGIGCNGQRTISKGNANGCPMLLENTDIFIPKGISESIVLKTYNLVPEIKYKCTVENQTEEFTATVNAHGNTLTCTLQITFEDNGSKKQFPISIIQNEDSGPIELDEYEGSFVTVYNCGKLASDCTMCNALNQTRYSCRWCNASTSCVQSSTCSEKVTKCPAPKITKIQPDTVGFKCNTIITIFGTNFGTNKDEIQKLMVTVPGGSPTVSCFNPVIGQINDTDFEPVINLIKCQLNVLRIGEDESHIGKKGSVTFQYNGTQAETGTFTFQKPNITSIEPNFGPTAGGTIITLNGNNLLFGNKLERVSFGTLNCQNHSNANRWVLCTTPKIYNPLNVTGIKLKYDGEYYATENISFRYLASPKIIDQRSTVSTIVSGGTKEIFEGDNLQNAAISKAICTYANSVTEGNCTIINAKTMSCSIPDAPLALKKEMAENNVRRKRSTSDGSITAILHIKMDGYEKMYELKYYKDPIFDIESTPVLKKENTKLSLTGNYLTLAATASDYTVTIGLDNNCEIIEVTATNLTCYLPDITVEDSSQFAVVVRLGNFYQNVTFVRYDLDVSAAQLQNVLLIVLPIAGGLLLLILIGGMVCTYKYRVIKTKAKKLEQNMQDIELKFKQVIREGTPDRDTSFPTNRSGDQVTEQSNYMELDRHRNPEHNYESLDRNPHHAHPMIANQSSNTGIDQPNDYERLDRNENRDRHIYSGLDKTK